MFKGSWEEHKTSFLGPVFHADSKCLLDGEGSQRYGPNGSQGATISLLMAHKAQLFNHQENMGRDFIKAHFQYTKKLMNLSSALPARYINFDRQHSRL